MTAPPWLQVLDDTIAACGALRRGDIAGQLQQRRARLLDPRLRIVVTGMPGQGKTQLAGALLDAPMPAADTATDLPARSAELAVVDTPGFAPVDGEAALDAVGEADAVVLAADATHELSATELSLVARVARGCPVAVALTKVDLVPDWRELADRDRARLAGAGVAAPLLPVSTALHQHAARSGDPRDDAESGFPALVSWLRRQAAAKQGAGAVVAALATTAIAQLAAPLQDATSGASQGTPAATRQAQQRIDELRKAASRCQTVVADEMADLISDVEHDLRQRTRQILREVDRAFEQADPAATWEPFADWLRDNLAAAGEANLGWLVDRARWVAARVAEELPVVDPAPHPLPELEAAGSDDPGDVERPRFERFGAGQMAFTGMRGSYGGVLMFGLLTSLAGMHLINPISLAAGVAFAGKSIRDEGESRLRRRQLAARTAAQRYVDDFFIHFSKYCRDLGRQTQRALRDHVSTVVEQAQAEIVRRAGEAAAEQAARTQHEAGRARAQLSQLIALHSRARALASTPARAIPS